MKSSPRNIILILIFTLAVFTACKDQWEDHNALKQNVLAEDLGQLVISNSSLSKFAQYLEKTGYDKILASSKSFTVWAPNNDALTNLDASIVNDSAKLSQFIGNHISYQEYPTNQNGKTVRIKMLSGKYIEYISGSTSIEGASIEDANSNLYCKNGILHVIKSPLYPKLSLWEYFNGISDASVTLQKSFLQNDVLSRVFDASLSKRTGYNSEGRPIYDSVWVTRNQFLYYINDISKEDSVYTYFVIKDDAFSNEYNKMKPYVADTSTLYNYSDWYTKWVVCKDFVVRGKYTKDNLPNVLISTMGIAIPKDSITIDSQYDASNGTVFVVSNFKVPIVNKIPEVIIEGEHYSATYNSLFAPASVPLLGIRERAWASGGQDLYIPGGTNGHRTAYLSVLYRTPTMYTITYEVSWKAVNDFQSSSFTQKLAVNANSIEDIRATTYLGDTCVRMKTILPNNYSEVVLGHINNVQFGGLRLYLVANEQATSSPNNPMILDYIKLKPVF